MKEQHFSPLFNYKINAWHAKNNIDYNIALDKLKKSADGNNEKFKNIQTADDLRHYVDHASWLFEQEIDNKNRNHDFPMVYFFQYELLSITVNRKEDPDKIDVFIKFHFYESCLTKEN